MIYILNGTFIKEHLFTSETTATVFDLQIHDLFRVSFRRFLFSLLLLLFNGSLAAQFYLHGQDPANQKWEQFSSEHYQYIFPSGLDSLAVSFSHTLEYFYPFQAKVFDFLPGKMPVIMHNEVSYSNGIFIWAPKRLEIFTNPDPNILPQDWMLQLALHEGRHSFQISMLYQGWGKALSYIAGEQAVGALTGFLPLWYLEGDAVDAESRFSRSGRGRLPSFEMGTKAILLEKGRRYSFSKAALGSYKDYVPDHYEFGYLLVRYARRTYGDKFWRDAELNIANKPFELFPMTFSFRNYGVQSKVGLYNTAFNFYEDHWEEGFKLRKSEDYLQHSGENRYYTNYRFPFHTEEGQIVAIKSGLDIIPEIVLIDSAAVEKRLHQPGYMNTGRIDYVKDFIVWDEWVPDLRWTNRNYSEIKLLNVQTGEVKRIGRKQRYYAPVLSGDASKIATIEQNIDYSFNLVILDLEGNVLRRIPSPNGKFIQHPAWMENDTAIVVVVSKEDGESIWSYGLNSDSWTDHFYSGFENISFPTVHGYDIYFTSTFNGIDNIYCFDLKSGKLRQHTNSAFGAFDPYYDERNDQLYFSEYHSDGYRICSGPADKSFIFQKEEISQHSEQIDKNPGPEELKIIEGYNKKEEPEYEISPYSKLKNTFKIHSWLPLYFNYLDPEAALTPERIPVSFGASILTQNLLSTVEGMLGYEYRDKTHFLHSGVRFYGKYPVFDFKMNYGGLPVYAPIENSDPPEINPNRLTISLSSYLPLRFNTGKYITLMQPLLNYNYTSDILPNKNRSGYISGIHYFHYRFYFASYLRKGVRDILPRTGVAISAGYRDTPFNKENFGSLSYVEANIYLPGLFKHQTLKFGASMQVQNPVRYLLSNSIMLPRGIQTIRGTDLRMIKADYAFPIAYPDLSIEPVFYLKRIRANIWSDYLIGREVLVQDPKPAFVARNYLSYGADLLFDFHVFRFFFPFSMGARLSYIPGSGSLVPELLFNIDVN